MIQYVVVMCMTRHKIIYWIGFDNNIYLFYERIFHKIRFYQVRKGEGNGKKTNL